MRSRLALIKDWILPLASLGVLGGCGFGAEGTFVDGRRLDDCFDTIPACSVTAGCRLGGDRYIETNFPGSVNFIVPAPAEAEIRIGMFFRNARAIGLETQVLVNEPGCFETYEWVPPTADIFRLAGEDQTLIVTQQVFFSGEHLVEIFSDSTTEVLIRAEVEAAGGGQR
ncbi:MAG: hypothetical protein ACFB9M_19790 [Myxococcota bacterium]